MRRDLQAGSDSQLELAAASHVLFLTLCGIYHAHSDNLSYLLKLPGILLHSAFQALLSACLLMPMTAWISLAPAPGQHPRWAPRSDNLSTLAPEGRDSLITPWHDEQRGCGAKRSKPRH